MISVAKGFQTSINILYDLNNDEKVKSFIPTLSSLDVMEEVLLSTIDNSTQRARLLVGAYGRGKSHIILVLLSMLFKKDIGLFTALLNKMHQHNPKMEEFAREYICGSKRLLPIIISGSSASLSQSFLSALQQALKTHDLENLMPETHYQAAIDMIINWENKYPKTYRKLVSILEEPIEDFIASLKEYNIQSYEKFESIYHDLTSGGKFNPYVGFDVVELYEAVVDSLQGHGYSGAFIIYDEFSKYLEASIANASVSDIKMLQDFAEKCNRSGSKQMHLMLISHKDISNYIDDKLPKEKVDGWRGVSGRFKHLELHNNFSQMYEIITAVIKKDGIEWPQFIERNAARFEDIRLRLSRSGLIEGSDIETAVAGCYPLHPISTFILPRLSEKVAQNERTLFTFLSAEQKYSLADFLSNEADEFELLTPDYLYDYFEPLMRKEAWTSETYKHYKMAETVLRKVAPDSLEAKIIKSITLIYVIEQYDKLSPIADVIIDIFRDSVSNTNEITHALDSLIDKDCIVYQKRSNGYLKIKNTSGVDILGEIRKMQEKTLGSVSLTNILNASAFDNYIYPTGYNDEHDITRYFNFKFISSQEFFAIEDWAATLRNDGSDGTVYAIVPKNAGEIEQINTAITQVEKPHKRIVFVTPTTFVEIDKIANEYYAVSKLKELVVDDELLADEYGIYFEDLQEVISSYIYSCTRPELRSAEYFYMGKKQTINRKSQISALLSKICEESYPYLPIINNESINKNVLPTMAINSRTKLIVGLLENDLTPNLGLTGTGQDVSFMRSTLIQTGVLMDADTNPRIQLEPENENMRYVLSVIQDFFVGAQRTGEQNFKEIYNMLSLPKHGIGIKAGVIPVYIAAVLHVHKNNLVIKNLGREVKVTADLLNSINEVPSEYTVYREDWTAEKVDYMSSLEAVFIDFVIVQEKKYNSFDYLVAAMHRWFISLPKYAKEMVENYQGQNSLAPPIPLESKRFVGGLKQTDLNAREFLFETVPSIFGEKDVTNDIANRINKIKIMYSEAINDLILVLTNDIRSIFVERENSSASLSSIILDWLDGLNDAAKNHLFAKNENHILEAMYTVTNDEALFVRNLAKKATSLRLEDWNNATISTFITEMKKFKEVVTEFNENRAENNEPGVNIYRLSFVDENGKEIAKTFEKSEYGPRAGLLYNEMWSNIEEYGQALTEHEKRQVLLHLLEKICKE